jgi:hypothetical protein
MTIVMIVINRISWRRQHDDTHYGYDPGEYIEFLGSHPRSRKDGMVAAVKRLNGTSNLSCGIFGYNRYKGVVYFMCTPDNWPSTEELLSALGTQFTEPRWVQKHRVDA